MGPVAAWGCGAAAAAAAAAAISGAGEEGWWGTEHARAARVAATGEFVEVLRRGECCGTPRGETPPFESRGSACRRRASSVGTTGVAGEAPAGPSGEDQIALPLRPPTDTDATAAPIEAT